MINSKSIIIIGGGIGGLFAAWKLSESGFKITLLERQKFLGGFSTSIPINDCMIDIGPHYVSIERDSKIFDDILTLVKQENIIELPLIDKSYRSYFHGHILTSTPRLYFGLTNDFLSKINGILNLFLSKLRIHRNKITDPEKYLISLYGKSLYNSWCKPLLIQSFGLIPPLDYIKNSFEPITFKRIFQFLKNEKSGNSQNTSLENNHKMFNCYFKHGMGSIVNSLERKIKDNGGQIILEADIQSIKREKIKSVVYKKNNENFIETSDIIIYSIPFLNILQWFDQFKIDSNSINITNVYHSIMIFLLIDTPKLFDGWILNIFDLSVPFHRVTQQTFLSKYVAPPRKTLLCIEIRSFENDPLWSLEDSILFKKTKNNLIKLKILNNEKVKFLKILKFKNLYRSRFSISDFDEKEIETYINSHENEFALGTAKVDSGRLVSGDSIKNEKQTKSFGGFYAALLRSNEIIKKIELNSKVD